MAEKWFQVCDHQAAVHRVPEGALGHAIQAFSNHTQNFTPARKAAQEAETASSIGMSHDLRVMPRPSEACSTLRHPGRSQPVPCVMSGCGRCVWLVAMTVSYTFGYRYET